MDDRFVPLGFAAQQKFEAEQTAALAELERTPLLKPSYFDFGMGFNHNMPCCIYADTECAVLDTNKGVFTPSWKARKEGWRLVKAETKLQRWLLKKFFNVRGFD